jgi:hypothetical protein
VVLTSLGCPVLGRVLAEPDEDWRALGTDDLVVQETATATTGEQETDMIN